MALRSSWYRMSLLTRFTLTGLSVTIGIGLVLGFALGYQLEQKALRQEANSAADQVSLVLDPFVRREDFEQPLASERYAIFDKLIRETILHDHIVQIKVWNAAGDVIYSDDLKVVGEHHPENHELREALEGEIAVEISDLSKGENEKKDGSYSRLMEVYVPIRLGDQIVGAYELYHDLAVTDPLVDDMRRFVWVSVVLSFGVLYLALFHRVRRASRELTRAAEVEQRALRQSEKRFRSLVANASDVITILDAEGRLRYQSPAAEYVWGYSPDKLSGAGIRQFVHPEEQATAQDLLAQALASPGTNMCAELRLRHADGTWRDFEVIVNNLLADPGVAGIVATYRDITERKRSEEALRESNLRLTGALDELHRTQQQIVEQARLRAMGRMASGIAHDFNNVLSPIVGYSELLLKRPHALDDREKVKEFVRLINIAGHDAAKVVSRLREFYRQREEGEVFAPVELNDLIAQAISLTQPKWKDQALATGSTIGMETELQFALRVVGNAAELREALTNLIFNAVDSMPNGGTITIRARAEGEQVILEISDTGIGMTEEVRRRCLEPFFTTRGERGTGLGLGMVYGIVLRHTGTLDIASEPGKGTTVSIRLPIERAEAAAELSPATPEDSWSPLRVLVVDDEMMMRRMLSDYLSDDGHTVETAENGREGLAKFRAGAFDVVMTDRAMPKMSGDQLTAEIKQISPNQPVIMLTGFGELMRTARERPAGVDLVVGKPVTPTALRQAIAEVVPVAG